MNNLAIHIAFVASVGATSSLAAGTIYTTYLSQSGEGFALAVVNPTTGEVTEIGFTGINIQGLAYDPRSANLFAVATDGSMISSLYIIDTDSAVASLIGSVGIEYASGLAVNSTSGEFFAVGNSLAPNHGTGLYAVDPFSGASSQIGSYGDEYAASLAYLPMVDSLVFTTGFYGGGNEVFGLYNSATGAQTVVSHDAPLMFGIDYDPDNGLLYGINGAQGAPGLGDQLFTIDPLTGQATLAITLSRTEHYASLAVIPDIPAPGALILAACPLALAARRRR